MTITDEQRKQWRETCTGVGAWYAKPILDLLDALEACEKERDVAESASVALAFKVTQVEAERDSLKAKLAEAESGWHEERESRKEWERVCGVVAEERDAAVQRAEDACRIASEQWPELRKITARHTESRVVEEIAAWLEKSAPPPFAAHVRYGYYRKQGARDGE